MNLGLLTYHAAHNYGAVLQAFGLQRELSRLGHESQVVHYYSHQTEARNRYKRAINSPKDLISSLAYQVFSKPLTRRYERFDWFVSKYLKVTERYQTYEELSGATLSFDGYICGSDQIWNFTNGASPVYYLRFLDESEPAIAYAPSFGKAVAAEDAPPELAEWIGRFQYLSARESNGVEIIKSLTARDVPQVVDPAFFLSGDEWGDFAIKPNETKPYLLFYALEINSSIIDYVSRIAKALNLNIIIAGKGGRLVFSKNSKLAIDSGPAEFLGLLQGASLVLSNSFHATVFSLLFRVPFLTMGHSTRNARIESLLDLVGAQKRLIMPDAMQEMPNAALLADGCPDVVTERLDASIIASRDFLKSSVLDIEGGMKPALTNNS